MKTLAAVLVELNKPLVLQELEIPALRPGQLLVETLYSGVCHTQLLEARGYRGPDKFLPHCLGHEGVGRVLETGPGATRFKAGQNVVLSWMKGPGSEGGGVQYDFNGQKVNAGPIATFIKNAVISENRVSPLIEGIDLRSAAMLGCAAPTGFGLVFNTLKAQAGKSLAVFGLGGIGLCAVAAGKAAGCGPIIAIDPRADRREAAKKMGATAMLEGGAPDPVDYAVEATGRPDVMRTALSCVKPQGGSAAIAGNARFGEKLEIDPKELNMGKRLLGSWGGDNEPGRDFPKYAALLAEKRVDLSPLTTAVYPFAKVNEALNDLEAGRALRPILDFN